MDNFYDDDFEMYLKKHADQFKMEPSKKVWHGIYNNFHPGRRWPSIATGLMIILLLSVTNNLNTRQKEEISTYDRLAVPSVNKNLSKSKNGKLTKEQIADRIIEKSILADLLSAETFINQPGSQSDIPLNNSQQNSQNNTTSVLSSDLTEKQTTIQPEKKLGRTSNNVQNNSTNQSDVTFLSDNISTLTNSEKVNELKEPFSNNVPVNLLKAEINSGKNNQKNKNAEQINNIFKRVNHRNIFWNFYVSPTLNYRIIGNSTGQLNSLSSTNPSNGNPDVAQSTFQHIAPGIEIGTNFSIPLAKHLEFVSGLQLNYSGYNITASQTHPVLASILLMNNGGAPSEASNISYYSNELNLSPVILHDYNIEASIPIGLRYQVMDYNRVSLNFMTSFQPTFILKEKSYILSTDTRNYISYPSLKRNLNFNGEFGAFIGFNIHHLRYEVGPEFRYQLLSNYKKDAPYSEHLINYGVRFAISR